MYSINYYSTDKDYAVTAATGRAFNSSTFCLPARSTSFMFIYGSHSNRQCALSLPFLYVYWRGYRKKIMSKIRPTEMSFLYSEPRIFNFVVSITLSITFLLNQYLSDFTESDKMVEKNLRVPWPCIFIWFCFKSFMEITNSVFNYKRLFC